MKAISIWQPHASLLMSGLHKPYETRSWKPWPQLIGQRIWIHAGKNTSNLDAMMEYLVDRANGEPTDPVWESFGAALKQMGYQHLIELPRGCLLGTAVLNGFHRTEDLVSPGVFGDFGPNRFAWHFTDHRMLSDPIPFQGKQGFFDVPAHIVAP